MSALQTRGSQVPKRSYRVETHPLLRPAGSQEEAPLHSLQTRAEGSLWPSLKGWSNQTDQWKVAGWGGHHQAFKSSPCPHRREQLPWWSRMWGPVRVGLSARDRQCLQRPMQRECGSEHWHVCSLWNRLLLPGEVLRVKRGSERVLLHKAKHSSLKV